jgi:hypothetical protein
VSAGESEGSGRDPRLEAYVEAIEAVLRVRRGVEHTLSSRDFALARGWFDAGVPLATVLVGIDLAFDAESSVSSLAFCRRRVEELAAGLARTPSALGEAERMNLPELGEVLAALHERLLQLPRGAAALPALKVQGLRDLVSVASRPNWEHLRERLREVDELVSAAAVEALEAAEARSLRAEAARLGERHRGRVDARALADAVERLVRQRARERLRLPRVAGFS